MITKLAAAFLVLIAAVKIATAEPLMMGIALQCESEPGKIFAMVQDKYGEIPFSTGEVIMQNITGAWQQGRMYTFINPESKSFTMIVVDPISEVECLLVAGKNFAPAVPGPSL